MPRGLLPYSTRMLMYHIAPISILILIFFSGTRAHAATTIRLRRPHSLLVAAVVAPVRAQIILPLTAS